MSLPTTEAGMRELEPKCESREAAASKRTVTRLQAQSPAFREGFINNCCLDGLANLARCAIEAQVSPNTRAVAHPTLPFSSSPLDKATGASFSCCWRVARISHWWTTVAARNAASRGAGWPSWVRPAASRRWCGR
jgi:hypothetical protein